MCSYAIHQLTTTSLTEDYNLELSYRKPFLDIWQDEKNDPDLGPLSERMGVRDRETGELRMTPEEQEAASEYSSQYCANMANKQASTMRSAFTKCSRSN